MTNNKIYRSKKIVDEFIFFVVNHVVMRDGKRVLIFIVQSILHDYRILLRVDLKKIVQKWILFWMIFIDLVVKLNVLILLEWIFVERNFLGKVNGNFQCLEDVQVGRPEEAISELIDHFKPMGQKIKIARGQKLSFTDGRGHNFTFILTKGCVSVLRVQNDLTVSCVTAPMFMGLPDVLNPVGFHYLRAETDVELVSVSHETILREMDKKMRLWKCATILFGYLVQRLVIRDTRIFGRSSYHIIRRLIIQLGEEPEIVRKQTRLAQYILDRTTISRSSVMDIISQLRVGEYIVLENGRLKSIKTLPAEF